MDVPIEFSSYTRVLRLASTPSWEEFSRVSLIAGLGIAVVGFLGFLMFITMTVLPGGV